MATDRSRKGKGIFWSSVVLASCLLVFMMPAMCILFLFGMLPTWVAGFVARHGMGRVQVTAALNFSGLLPFIAELWAGDGSLRQLMDIGTNVYAWATVYGAAAATVLYLWLGPQIAVLYLDMKAARFIQHFTERKTRLLDEWGDALAPDKINEKPDLQ